MIFPFYWMITGSLKTLEETTRFPPNFVPANWFNYENYVDVWKTSNVPFTTYYMNSIIVCAGSVCAVMVTTVLAAYAFARLQFPGRDVIFTLLLSMMMIPFELLVITNSQTIVRLGMKNELTSLIVPFISSIFYTYILRNFFMSVPDSLYSAATVDGCSNWSYLWKVMFPIARPSLVTILLLNAMASWNSFMWPQLVISEPAKRTLPWALTCFQTEAGAKDNVLMAAATLVVLPMLIMFLFARKQIVSGVSRGGIKG
ncbi:MAG: ABC transporter permease [Clostridiales bacterium]|nr:ABC transporter permease [Clostridiales bacterium]